MDAGLFVDADCSGDCRSSRAGHSNGNRSRSSVCKNRRSLEWRAFQPEIPGVPVRPRRGIHSVFWCSIFGKSTYRPRLFVDSHPDRFLADIPRRTLSVRRGLRCGSWISLRSAYGTAFSSRNRKSAIENRKLDGGGGEIRTHEAFRPAGFQDQCNQPLCHPSRNRSGSTCLVARNEQLDSRRSHFFPIGTVPAEKFIQSLDIGLVKINKIFSLVTGDFACIRRRTGFYIV